MKLFANLLVVAAAAGLTGVAAAAPKKGADANECFVCKVNGETVELQGKTCFTNKDKKKAAKECTKQKGKWVQETATPTGMDDAAPSEEMPME